MDPLSQRLLHDSLRVSATRLPDKPVVVAEGIPHTFSELLEASLRLSGWLRRTGFERGDRAAIFMDNTWPAIVSIFATLSAGGAFMVVNPQTKSDKLRYMLADSGARVLMTDGHLSKVFAPALAGLPALQHVVCSGALPDPRAVPTLSYDEALGGPAPADAPSRAIPVDLAALIYTSGSTGHPKGVMMTHQAMTFTAGSLIEYLRLTEADRILNVLPLAFDYGLYQLLMSIRLGATLVLERSFAYPALVLGRMASERVTVFPGVPTVYMSLIGMHARSPLRFPEVRRITNTAASLSPEIVPRLRQIFPNALVFRMYGLTECKRVCYLEPELVDQKPESVGKAIPGTEVYLLSEAGEPVAPGQPGILHVRGPHVMLGYWNKPDETSEMLRPGRYPGERVLCTHDWFTQDADGDLYFQGRSDDIIKCRGEKVSPVEVENCLHGIPGVREAAVVGVPDDLQGEAVRAFVALEPGSGLTEKDLKAVCISRLENFMVPREVVILPDLPKTASGKIRKKDLRGVGKAP
jgi:acyl-CoA synthetase (AMP-forming)/AMP-acid ligase II